MKQHVLWREVWSVMFMKVWSQQQPTKGKMWLIGSTGHWSPFRRRLYEHLLSTNWSIIICTIMSTKLNIIFLCTNTNVCFYNLSLNFVHIQNYLCDTTVILVYTFAVLMFQVTSFGHHHAIFKMFHFLHHIIIMNIWF